MEEDDDVAAAMAEAMGFSSFGGPKSNKRRKFNPSADAVVDSDSNATSASQASSNRGGPMSSGSNSTPLGIRAQNKDEIALDLDNDDDDGESGSAFGAATAIQDTIDEDDPDPEPQYIDTSRPSAPVSEEPGGGLEAKIDSIVGAYHGRPSQPSTVPVFNTSTRGGRGGRGGYQPTRGRDRDQGKKWWEDYYDPTSNVNPWERLERDQGLKPRGQWMSWEEAKR